MCRIAGIIAPGITGEERLEKVTRMCAWMHNGGPDAQGVAEIPDAALVFGHRRLAILDLSARGNQPMSRGSELITFNGEIYNYRELKEELLADGQSFASGTDTEVILSAYQRWGTAAFGKLQGMFAFALHDRAKGLTHLVRDTQGIKPLYYHIAQGQLCFSSEVKALRHAGIAQEEDENWRVRFLAFGHVPEPFTTLKGVRSLPKGACLTWDHRPGSHQIFFFTAESGSAGEPDAGGSVAEVLRTAVRRQLIADAPLGVFLSGGLDSSLLALLASAYLERPLRTVSIVFNEAAYNESAYQSLVAGKINAERSTHLVGQQDFDKYLPEVLTAMDMPTSDGINTWFISKYARESGLKAVLSGIGADETFGGYPSFRRIKYLGYLRKLPGRLLALGSYLPTDKYRKSAFLAHRHYLADYLLLRGLFVPDEIAGLLGADRREVNTILFGGVPDIDPGNYDKDHAAWLESNLYMQNQLLRDTDVMSMSHGLEVRVPYLDEAFQRHVKNMPSVIRFGGGRPKGLLIDSFAGLLPKEIVLRRKMGFSFPLQEWMKKNARITEGLTGDHAQARLALKKFHQGRLHWSKIFALYQLRFHA